MSMKLRHLRLRVQTTDGLYGTDLPFADGLAVIWADNTMGKSTCVRSIMVALGLEASLTTSQTDLPLAPAVKSMIEGNNGIHEVLESSVLLEIENRGGERITVERTIRGSRDIHLITVHPGARLSAPDTPASRAEDFYVGRSGSATRDRGFHQFLAQFLGWELPSVQTFDGRDCPLYLQCIFPFLIIEQTRGWSSILPPIPSHFKIKDVHKRAVEFLMSMDAHRIALRRFELLSEKERVETEWTAIVRRAAEVADTLHGKVQSVPSRPVTTWPGTIEPTIIVPHIGVWAPVEMMLESQEKELSRLIDEEIPKVSEIATVAQAELVEAEQTLRDQESLHARVMQSLQFERGELEAVQARVAALDEDLKKNRDVKVLQGMGSTNLNSAISNVCPTCHQHVEDSLLPVAEGQSVMSLDENIEFLTEQRRTFMGVLANAARRVEYREAQALAVQEEAAGLRERIRALRQTLISDGRQPSIAAIQQRLSLEIEIKKTREVIEKFGALLDEFGELAGKMHRIAGELSSIPRDDTTERDKAKVARWSQIFVKQLHAYGFRSLPLGSLSLSPYTYKPEYEGYDFPSSISASDLIRSIWAYLNAMVELAREEQVHHPGMLIFDEPRQQSTRRESFTELMRRASTSAASKQQTIFFTSEAVANLQESLLGLPHTFVKIDGRIIKKIGA